MSHSVTIPIGVVDKGAATSEACGPGVETGMRPGVGYAVESSGRLADSTYMESNAVVVWRIRPNIVFGSERFVECWTTTPDERSPELVGRPSRRHQDRRSQWSSGDEPRFVRAQSKKA